MKIIPESHKKARLWVEACAASLDVEKAVAAAMYANICGFGSWNSIVQIIGTQQPSPLDETLNSEQLSERRSGYIEILVSVFDMNPSYASYLVSHLSPTSGKHPKKIAFNAQSMHGSEDDAGIPLIPPGMESMMEEGMEAFLAMMKENHPEFADFDTTNFAERLRISKPLNPGLYYDFCKNLGWDLDESSYEEDYVFGEASFSINSPKGKVLVYANSIVQTPYDTEDEMANHVRTTVVEDAYDFSDDPRLILFWGQPMTKKVKDLSFTCLGSIYVNGSWSDMLLNTEMRNVDTMLEMVSKGIDFNNPDPIFADKHNLAARIFLALSIGAQSLEELNEYEIMQFGSPSGWNSPMVSEKR